jgi:hypothetical protein
MREVQLERKPMGLKQILKKADTPPSRREIEAAVTLKAVKLAKRDNISLEVAELQVWKKYPNAQAAYESSQPDTRPPKSNGNGHSYKCTKAEIELDARARKRMKRTSGLSYEKAVQHELDADPGLYDSYQQELSANQVNQSLPLPEYRSNTRKQDATGSDGECPNCGEDVEGDMNYCPDCGADLTKGGKKAS